jgi:hypothetical protein
MDRLRVAARGPARFVLLRVSDLDHDCHKGQIRSEPLSYPAY